MNKTLVILSLLATSAQAEIYQCTDGNGKQASQSRPCLKQHPGKTVVIKKN